MHLAKHSCHLSVIYEKTYYFSEWVERKSKTRRAAPANEVDIQLSFKKEKKVIHPYIWVSRSNRQPL